MIIKSFKDFQKNIAGNKISNFIVVHGNDKDKISKCEKEIMEIPGGIKELNTVTIEGNSISFDDIQNACETIPVMSDKRVVHVKSPSFTFESLDSSSKALLKDVTDYAKDVPEYTILMISSKDPIDKGNSLIKVSNTIGTLVELKIPMYGKDLSQWIETYIKDNKKNISKSDIFYLTNEMTSSIDNMEIELNKLISYIGDRENITKEDIDAVIHKTSESNIFKMTDYMYKKDAKNALDILDTIFLQGEQFPKIMFMIIRQFRILYNVRLLLDDGERDSDIIKKLKLQEFVYRGIAKIIGNWESNTIKNVLEDALETDYNIKSGKMQPELGLELLILRICK
ncbi:MAG: DNA polymerase III subunit delta [Clostridium sp.]|uniref:DNA polymerase III subunit delta n=1 Tax=Clostridium sp. TaxID=1506 RepID=UPI002FCBAD6C